MNNQNANIYIWIVKMNKIYLQQLLKQFLKTTKVNYLKLGLNNICLNMINGGSKKYPIRDFI